MAHRLNLAKRPFVDTRPVNLTAAALALIAVVLSVVSVRTVLKYFDDSRRTRQEISSLREEISGLESERRAAEARLQRFDIAQLEADATDANEISLRRSFSWTRFLSRLERTLPADIRVVSIALSKNEQPATAAARRPASDTMTVNLILISRDPNGLPKAIRAFYNSPWFDRPTPIAEEGQAKGVPEGRRINLSVTYKDVAP